MDILGYTYDAGNKLVKVTDTGNVTYGFKDGANLTTEYTYDVNGNMKTDANKSITAIQYNYLNLPTQVSFGSTKNINYIYDASGTKLKKVVNDNGTIITTDYAGNFIYENNVLQFFNQPEGYVEPSGSSFNYIYQYKDHLGNIRLSYADSNGDGVITASTEIKEENNYYPFGLKHKGYNNNINGTHYKYMFGGKELSEDLGLNTYDFGARNYDPALGRWMNTDPLAETSRRYSPYAYALDNPVFFIDPDGMEATGDYWSKNGKYLGNDGKDDKKLYAVENNGYRTDGDGASYIAKNKTTEIKGVTLQEFMDIAGIANGETSGTPQETFAFANTIVNNMTDGKSETEATSGNFSYAKSDKTDSYTGVVNSSLWGLNGTEKQIAVAGAINSLTGGFDYSNGAKGWDGVDVLQGSPNPKSSTGHNSPANHYRQRSGGISDPLNLSSTFYKNSQNFIGRKFGVGGKEYRAILPMILNKNVQGRPQYEIQSTYGASVFYNHR